MKKIWKLYKKHEEIINYIIVGGITTGISLGIKYLLLFTILDAKKSFELQVSVIISWIGAVLFAYYANRKYVFYSKSKEYIREFISFAGGRLLTLGLEMIFMWFFVNLLGFDSNMWVVTFTIICQILILIANYIVSKFWVFIQKS